jgi:hypothetical protein
VETPDVEGYQKIAAEQVAGDEAWRDGVEDEVAEPLLDWALQCTDAAVARLGGAGGLTEDAAYEAADQARALLDAVGSHWRGEAWEAVAEAIGPSLGPPLFESPAAGAEAVVDALTRARVEPGGAEAVAEALRVERPAPPPAPDEARPAVAPEVARPAAEAAAPSKGDQKEPASKEGQERPGGGGGGTDAGGAEEAARPSRAGGQPKRRRRRRR